VNTILTKRSWNEKKADSKQDGDPLADFASEAHTIYKDKKEGEEGADAGEDAKSGGEKDKGDDEKERSREDSTGDKDKGEHGGARELERELDRRAAQRAEKDGGLGSKLDQPLTNAKDDKKRMGNSGPAGGRGESRKESIEKFDKALREICKEGLFRELPAIASMFNDRMRRMFRGWQVENTPFERFGNLLRAAEEEGLIKVVREGSQLKVTWIKYKYHVLPPRSPQRDAGRRDRSRSRRPGKGSGRGDRGPQGRGGEQDRGRGARARPSRGRARAGGSRARSRNRGKTQGSRDRGRGRGDRDRGRDKARDKRRKESSSPDYSYSYQYSDEDSGSGSGSSSPSRSPPRGKRKSRSPPRRKR